MVSVGNDTVKTCCSLHELDHPGTVFFFFFKRSVLAGGRASPFVQGGELLLHTRGIMIVSRRVCGNAPTRQLRNAPIAVSGSGHPGKLNQVIKAVIHR